MSEWQPIETAPKDGTKMILADLSDGGPVPSNIGVGAWEFVESNDWDEKPVWDWAAYAGTTEDPTHWMPLPDPPEVSRGLKEWPPERLRALDRAVAQARGWTENAAGWVDPMGRMWASPQAFSAGCRNTFELMEEEQIIVAPSLLEGQRWQANTMDSDIGEGPTPAIAICLAYLASKGRSFNG